MFRRAIVFIVTGLLFCWADVAYGLEDRVAQIRVGVFNDAHASSETLFGAEMRAGTILRAAGVDVMWVDVADCAALQSPSVVADHKRCGPTDFSIRIVPHSLTLTDSIFGVSFLGADGSGRYCDVFYATAHELSESDRLNLGQVLGHVMAHELGHLLLGSNAHSRVGIMQPHWSGEELRSLAMGKLLFSREQGQLMSEKIRRETASALTSAGPSWGSLP